MNRCRRNGRGLHRLILHFSLSLQSYVVKCNSVNQLLKSIFQLRDLPLEDLLKRMSGLESEMDRELEELRRRYQTKRQPILDAIESKKQRMVNFWIVSIDLIWYTTVLLRETRLILKQGSSQCNCFLVWRNIFSAVLNIYRLRRKLDAFTTKLDTLCKLLVWTVWFRSFKFKPKMI